MQRRRRNKLQGNKRIDYNNLCGARNGHETDYVKIRGKTEKS